MADTVKVQDAILSKIVEQAQDVRGTDRKAAQNVLDLAEALAWITSPGQPHSGLSDKE